MISLHVYLTPKAGESRQLESAIKGNWLPAMAEQPGFLRAALLKPFSDEDLDELDAARPQSAYEVVSFWRTESERRAWVARPIHDEVFSKVLEASDVLTFTLQTAEQSWNL